MLCKSLLADPLDAVLSLADITVVEGYLEHHFIVASLLEIPKQDIDDIESKYTTARQQRCEVLRKWIDMKEYNATFRVLYNVMMKLSQIEAAEEIRRIATDVAAKNTSKS